MPMVAESNSPQVLLVIRFNLCIVDHAPGFRIVLLPKLHDFRLAHIDGDYDLHIMVATSEG